MKILKVLALCLISLTSTAQVINKYAQAAGEDYWKNRKPHAAYWQQDVHYKMAVAIDDEEESVAGNEKLTYYNNSPDTLDKVYFHLYQNAFTPNSYAHNLRKSGKIKTTFGEHEAKGVGTEIQSLKVNGRLSEFEIDNTILIIELKEPLLPSSSIVFDIDFKTYWDKDDGGNMRRRMKTFEHNGVTHFDGVHWYPRICVYDRKFGWTTDQHLGKEFYGDFGLFDVELTFPSKYVVEATGELQNESEALPNDLREALDLKHYKDVKSPIVRDVTPKDGVKTWKYRAVNVHDFAFTADPSYRIGEVEWNGVKCIALAQEQNAHKWQPTALFVAKVVETYSNEIGMYGYPKIVAADARDGMEYPMITLNSGNWPRHQYVIAHEVGHNWFFGMIGTNETYRASLDEGFTQYLTALSLKKIANQDFDGNRIDKSVVYASYLSHAANDNSAVLATHSDHFNSAERHGGGYGQVYFKTGTMLYNLEYVLGKELFTKCMKSYFVQWKYAHPYWEDFKTSVIHTSKTDLNWFFDQWINTNKKIDYRVKGVKKDSLGNNQIHLKRKTTMQMPLDVKVQYADGSFDNFHIPNTYFVKNTEAKVLPKWTGWDEWNTDYSFSVGNDKKVGNVIIDPSERMADVYRLDNELKTPVSFGFSGYKRAPSDFDTYHLRWHPNVWYNSVDGLKLGIDIFGNYFGNKHVVDATLWYNSELLNDENKSATTLFAYQANYKNRIRHLTDFTAESRVLDGLLYHKLGVTKQLTNSTLDVYAKSLYRNSPRDLDYLLFPNTWQADGWNNTLNLEWTKPLKFENGNGTFQLNTRSAYLISDYNYAWLNGEVKRNLSYKKIPIKLRAFAQYASGDMAPESRLPLAGETTEAMMDNAWVRSTGFVPQSWTNFGNDFNHFHYGGGLNLRGFSGYEALNETDGEVYYIFTGNSGVSVNAEVDFAPILKIHKIGRKINLNTYLFADAGVLQGDFGGSGVRADAGLGMVGTYRPTRFNFIKPLSIRVDFPFFVNRLPYNQNSYFDFRYVIGIFRAF